MSQVEESANDPSEENMIVVREETQSQTEALSIVPIQVYVPLSQTNPMQQIEPIPVQENKPIPAKSPSEKINEETTKSTPEPPLKPEESTPMLPPAPSKINLAPEDAAALIMMARTASYIPKEGPMPSFSLGLTDSSQEEAATQEGLRAKTPEIPNLIEQLGDLVEKIAVCISFGVSQLLQNMAIENHPNGEFLQPKTNKPFRVEDYPMFIPFLDLKKLASHPYISFRF
ncbi:hypothetical protein Ahy_A05g023168 [Arachis hypogaea]|uniref:Uncharacterized protein n=1 Tax=Arachis hypogaea TaxID=3818 RepID=A0A445D334_ARAHY|nr:hypothetical protein Ahy_A05g023168 [Arachis hypogaea]